LTSPDNVASAPLCGQTVVRLEPDSLNAALVKRVERFEIGDHVMRPTAIPHTMRSLPASVTLV